jgi:uncharacterized protein YndB with AHSA1/START domain
LSRVEHEVRIAARPETVFAYFTDPVKLVTWMGLEATLDPRPGGVCRVKFSEEATMLGSFRELDPPHHLALTWGWEQELFGTGPQSTLVEVSLLPADDGTIVRLAHQRLPTAATGFHRAGWEHHLPRLEIAAAGGDPPPDPWRDPARARRELREIIGRQR